MMQAPYLTLNARDFTGNKRSRVSRIPSDSTVGELVDGLLGRMKLPLTGGDGQPLSYHPLRQRESRHLYSSEVVGEVLADDDEIVLHPSVEAGGPFQRFGC
jgi:hypothetical protein